MKPSRRFFLFMGVLVLVGGAGISACAGRVQAEPTGDVVTDVVHLMLTETLAPTPTSSPAPSTATPTVTIVPSPTVAPTFTPTAGPECQEVYCVYPGHLTLHRPVAGSLGDAIDPSYRYGDDQNGTREPHSGVEFPAQYGEAVLAAADGLVVVAGDDSATSFNQRTGFYGNLVILEHHFDGYSEPVYTLYAHLSEVGVVTGQKVETGEPIGAVGETGWANGPHLHFEVRVGGYTLDDIRNPELWLIPHETDLGGVGGAVAARVDSLSGQDLEVNMITLKPVDGAGRTTYYMKPYVGELIRSDDAWQETFALGDIPTGNYQWSVVAGGKFLQGIIPVQSGKTTVIQIEVE